MSDHTLCLLTTVPFSSVSCIGGKYEKRIERVTLAGSSATGGKVDPARDRIVRRAAKEFKDGMYVNLGKSSRG
jgi:hypothetical protein